MENFSKELQTAIDAAKMGAKKALEYFDNESDLKTVQKSDNTPVTVADTATEEVIKNDILSKFPYAKILGEETGGSTEDESFWIIDPIDGTRVYSRGINAWAVLIAYYTKGEFTIGVSYFPVLNEMYYAEKGKGAFLNGKRLNISDTNPLKNSLINSGNPQYYKKKQVIIDLVEKSGIVRGYETTYADCLVAAGKMDASIDNNAKLWDFAAFAVIIPEAGGIITDLEGKPLQLQGSGCIISNGLIHNELVKIVNK